MEQEEQMGCYTARDHFLISAGSSHQTAGKCTIPLSASGWHAVTWWSGVMPSSNRNCGGGGVGHPRKQNSHLDWHGFGSGLLEITGIHRDSCAPIAFPVSTYTHYVPTYCLKHIHTYYALSFTQQHLLTSQMHSCSVGPHSIVSESRSTGATLPSSYCPCQKPNRLGVTTNSSRVWRTTSFLQVWTKATWNQSLVNGVFMQHM